MADSTPKPVPVPAPDWHQVERLNQLYRIIDDQVSGGTLKARLASTARRLLGRVLSRQQEFNAAVVDHLNRNIEVATRAHQANAQTINWIWSTFDSASDEVRRQAEALTARERRTELAAEHLAAHVAELRSAVSVLQQAHQQLKREVGALGAGAVAPASAPATAPAPGPGTPVASPSVASSQFASSDSHKYVGFEDQFRGSRDAIRERVLSYLPYFSSASDVLDVGCGRGEFLDLLRQHGVRARGIDVNAAMLTVCQEQGLEAAAGDALEYLRGLPDGSLGGLFAAQVVEHLEPRYLTQLIDVAFDKLRPGSPIVQIGRAHV